jgi:malate dehydrogenase (oxaloacetate-decarboxylating)
MHPSASFSATIRVRIDNRPGAFAGLAATIGEAGGRLGAIDLVRVEQTTKLRDVNVLAENEHHLHEIVDAVRAVDGVEVVKVSDRTFVFHLGGTIEITRRLPLKTRDDLSMAYTPGVARISRAIADEPERAWNLTIKRNTVARRHRRHGGTRPRGHRAARRAPRDCDRRARGAAERIARRREASAGRPR